MPALYFEDFEAGQVYELGSRTVTEDEIVAFASQWDPQPLHADPVAARSSVFGGLIASGWHTGAMWMRLYVDSMLGRRGQHGLAGDRGAALARACPARRHAQRPADRARDHAVGAEPEPRHASGSAARWRTRTA